MKVFLIKPSKGSSYAEVLQTLKCKVKLSVIIKSVSQMRNGDVLVEVGTEAEGRTKLKSTMR